MRVGQITFKNIVSDNWVYGLEIRDENSKYREIEIYIYSKKV